MSFDVFECSERESIHFLTDVRGRWRPGAERPLGHALGAGLVTYFKFLCDRGMDRRRLLWDRD